MKKFLPAGLLYSIAVGALSLLLHANAHTAELKNFRLDDQGAILLLDELPGEPTFHRSRVVILRCQERQSRDNKLVRSSQASGCIEYFDSGALLDPEVTRIESVNAPRTPEGWQLEFRVQLKSGREVGLWSARPSHEPDRSGSSIRLIAETSYSLAGYRLDMGTAGGVRPPAICCQVHFQALRDGRIQWDNDFLLRYPGVQAFGLPGREGELQLDHPVVEATSIRTWPGSGLGYVVWNLSRGKETGGHWAAAVVDIYSGRLLNGGDSAVELDWRTVKARVNNATAALLPSETTKASGTPGRIELSEDGPPLPEGLDIGPSDKFNSDMQFFGDYRFAYRWALQIKREFAPSFGLRQRAD